MQHNRAISALGILLAGLLSLAGLHNAAAHQAAHQVGSVCHGFVILPNGHAVLSAVPAMPGHGTSAMPHGEAPQPMRPEHTQQPAGRHGPKPAEPHQHMAAGGHAAAHEQSQMGHPQHGTAQPSGEPTAQSSHLMGYAHGQDIVLRQDMLCVPLGGPEDTQWTAVSRDPALFVMAESRRGALAHNSRANEAFTLTVMRPGQDLSQARVWLLVRMPHHDRHLPGGHGTANDPDVQGLQAQRDDQGRYVVQTVDFSMPGSWLVEVQVQQNSDTHTAYFALDVGEE